MFCRDLHVYMLRVSGLYEWIAVTLMYRMFKSYKGIGIALLVVPCWFSYLRKSF